MTGRGAISNLYINRSTETQLFGVGLFSHLGSSGEILNLGVKGNSITGASDSGGMVGVIQGGVLKNCYTDIDMSSTSRAAGMAGWCSGTVEKCYTKGTSASSGASAVGGIVGTLNGGTIINCYAAGRTISSTTTRKGGLVGGIFGRAHITHCCSTATSPRGDFMELLLDGNGV